MQKDKQELLELFVRIEWLLHRHYHQYRMAYGPMGNPHKGQGRVLSILKIKPEITQKELTYLLDMRPQSLGELLSRMEQNGYIIRTTSEKDRRIIDIKLTEAGAEAANQGDQQSDFSGVFDCLSQEDQDSLRDYLSRIIDSLEQSLEADQMPKGFDGCGHGRGWEHHSAYEHPFIHGGQHGEWHGTHDYMGQGHPSHGGYSYRERRREWPHKGHPNMHDNPYTDPGKEDSAEPHQED